jgi:hypothetical protein
MSTFCRHGTLIESCPICRADVEFAERSAAKQRQGKSRVRATSSAMPSRPAAGRRGTRLTIRHETRAADDGFRTPLALGLRSSADAERLAAELARSAGRLALLADAPPGLYAEVATQSDIEEATWLALLIAYLGPLEAPDDPFEAISEVRTRWSSGELPDLAAARLGPRSPYAPERGHATLVAYQRWAERSGSQAAALGADPTWKATQRFERVFERLALPGLDRRARYDFLVTLGALGRYELTADSLLLSEDDPVSRAAKRVFGIGDRLALEGRVRELANAATVPVAAFDLALENWAGPARTTLGARSASDEHALERVRRALGLDQLSGEDRALT